MGVKPCDLLLEPVGAAHVVMVEHRKIFAARKVKQLVAGRGDPDVAVVFQISYARIGELRHDARPVVVGTVVENQELEIGEGLRKHALHRLPQETLVRAVYGHKH